jgi:hypothetical protein
MNWQRINYGRAENDRGVRVIRTGYKSMRYENGNRAITIDVEEGGTDLGIYVRSIKRWEPSDQLITDTERAVILEDVKAALKILGVPFTILWN